MNIDNTLKIIAVTAPEATCVVSPCIDITSLGPLKVIGMPLKMNIIAAIMHNGKNIRVHDFTKSL